MLYLFDVQIRTEYPEKKTEKRNPVTNSERVRELSLREGQRGRHAEEQVSRGSSYKMDTWKRWHSQSQLPFFGSYKKNNDNTLLPCSCFRRSAPRLSSPPFQGKLYKHGTFPSLHNEINFWPFHLRHTKLDIVSFLLNIAHKWINEFNAVLLCYTCILFTHKLHCFSLITCTL